jgi:hypothetical protein
MAVLLTQHKSGTCRAVIGEVHQAEVAMVCGEPAAFFIDKYGRHVEASWCEVHRKLYTQAPHLQQQRNQFSFRRRPLKPRAAPTVATMTVPEAGRKYFNVGKERAYQLSKAGKIPLRKVGCKRCVVIADLEAMIAKEKVTAVTGGGSEDTPAMA